MSRRDRPFVKIWEAKNGPLQTDAFNRALTSTATQKDGKHYCCGRRLRSAQDRAYHRDMFHRAVPS